MSRVTRMYKPRLGRKVKCVYLYSLPEMKVLYLSGNSILHNNTIPVIRGCFAMPLVTMSRLQLETERHKRNYRA